MHIISNNICYGSVPEPDKEIEQHLTINDEGTDLSDLVRDTVGMDDLYVFDGNCKPDVINRIFLDYHRLTKIKPKEELKDLTEDDSIEIGNFVLVPAGKDNHEADVPLPIGKTKYIKRKCTTEDFKLAEQE